MEKQTQPGRVVLTSSAPQAEPALSFLFKFQVNSQAHLRPFLLDRLHVASVCLFRSRKLRNVLPFSSHYLLTEPVMVGTAWFCICSSVFSGGMHCPSAVDTCPFVLTSSASDSIWMSGLREQAWRLGYSGDHGRRITSWRPSWPSQELKDDGIRPWPKSLKVNVEGIASE